MKKEKRKEKHKYTTKGRIKKCAMCGAKLLGCTRARKFCDQCNLIRQEQFINNFRIRAKTNPKQKDKIYFAKDFECKACGRLFVSHNAWFRHIIICQLGKRTQKHIQKAGL